MVPIVYFANSECSDLKTQSNRILTLTEMTEQSGPTRLTYAVKRLRTVPIDATGQRFALIAIVPGPPETASGSFEKNDERRCGIVF